MWCHFKKIRKWITKTLGEQLQTWWIKFVEKEILKGKKNSSNHPSVLGFRQGAHALEEEGDGSHQESVQRLGVPIVDEGEHHEGELPQNLRNHNEIDWVGQNFSFPAFVDGDRSHASLDSLQPWRSVCRHQLRGFPDFGKLPSLPADSGQRGHVHCTGRIQPWPLWGLEGQWDSRSPSDSRGSGHNQLGGQSQHRDRSFLCWELYYSWRHVLSYQSAPHWGLLALYEMVGRRSQI